jgi:hypothetical protein
MTITLIVTAAILGIIGFGIARSKQPKKVKIRVKK